MMTLKLLCAPSFMRSGCWLMTLLIDSRRDGHARYLRGAGKKAGGHSRVRTAVLDETTGRRVCGRTDSASP